jgi:hypothetical protein
MRRLFLGVSAASIVVMAQPARAHHKPEHGLSVVASGHSVTVALDVSAAQVSGCQSAKDGQISRDELSVDRLCLEQRVAELVGVKEAKKPAVLRSVVIRTTSLHGPSSSLNATLKYHLANSPSTVTVSLDYRRATRSYHVRVVDRDASQDRWDDLAAGAIKRIVVR